MSDFRNANDPLWRDAGYRSGARSYGSVEAWTPGLTGIWADTNTKPLATTTSSTGNAPPGSRGRRRAESLA